MFKRPRLRPASPLVNVSLAASLIFISACSGEKASIAPETDGDPSAAVVVEVVKPTQLQAVWATRALSSKVLDIAISGGPNPVLAAVLAGEQIQLFNLDGELLIDPETVGITKIGDGRTYAVNDVPLTLFPGIGNAGDLNVYVHNSALSAPVALDLLPNAGAVDLCSGTTETDGTLLMVAYWTESQPDTLIIGNVYEDGDSFAWDPIDEIAYGRAIGGCLLVAGEAPAIEPANQAAGMIAINNGARQVTMRRAPGGQIEKLNETGFEPISVRNGISVRTPEPIAAMAALSVVQFGGYPNGVIVVGGQVEGQSQLVFVEPIALFEDAAG
ncbi:MAG: hypothetical protein ABJG15_06695 [Hyphomonadaceae bacterium]